jgi:glutathione synthase/RimK-type ligase-like ATP-grasp enzyme
MSKNTYLYYSGATDKTGAELVKALGITGGTEMPDKTKTVVIGWGAKTSKSVDFGKAKVYNHPNSIRVNRNKMESMRLMMDNKVAVAPFVDAENVTAELAKAHPSVSLPLIGRTAFHQGGNEFFTCLTKTHVLETVKTLKGLKKSGYFQNYIDVKDEYRLHIFNGGLIVAAKKVPRDNLEAAYVEQQKEKIDAMAAKKGIKLDKATMEFALGYQANKISAPDQIIKSNTRGYKFAHVDVKNVSTALVAEAQKAVKALGLCFGAVDCVLDANGKAWVLEVNTGPGLEGTTFDAYVAAFKKLLDSAENKEKIVKETTKQSGEALKGAKAGGKTSNQAERLRTLADLIEVADDKQADIINELAKKLFS